MLQSQVNIYDIRKKYQQKSFFRTAILLLKSIYLVVHLTSNSIVEETTTKAATTPDTGSHILFMCKDIKDGFIMYVSTTNDWPRI